MIKSRIFRSVFCLATLVALSGCVSPQIREARVSKPVVFFRPSDEEGVYITSKVFDRDAPSLDRKKDANISFRVVNRYKKDIFVNVSSLDVSIGGEAKSKTKGAWPTLIVPGGGGGPSYGESYMFLSRSHTFKDGKKWSCACCTTSVIGKVPQQFLKQEFEYVDLSIHFMIDYYVRGDPIHYYGSVHKNVRVRFE